MKGEKETVILYHDNCSDGFGGAWAARRNFKDEAEYIGVRHREDPPEILEGKNVYIIDFAYPKETTDELLKKTRALTIIDHHITMKEVIEGVPNHLYNNDHSGAVLAWKHFFPDEETPLLLQYIEDGDLWKFELPRSKDFYSFIGTIPFEFDVWDKLVENFEDGKKRAEYFDHGKAVLEYQERVIEHLLEEGEEVALDGHFALAVNASMLESQIGNAIVNEGYDIGIIWSYKKGNDIRVSLRSGGKKDVHVGEIAKQYGGGGHKNAAGFTIKAGENIPWRARGAEK